MPAICTGTYLPNWIQIEIQALDLNKQSIFINKALRSLLNFKPRFKIKTVILLRFKYSDEQMHKAIARSLKEFVLLAGVKTPMDSSKTYINTNLP